MYKPYADSEYYINEYKGNVIPDRDAEKYLRNASRHIDVLTYNRIIGKGIDALAEYQAEIVREVCCELADFEYENEDVINNILQNYSINGVSMTFGSSWNVVVRNGVAVKKDIFEKLKTTGLCSRIL